MAFTVDPEMTPVRPSPSKREVAKALGSAMIGNWFELYDFIIYGYFAAQIGLAMFPKADPLTIILSSFATYGVGFVMRPIGSVVLGSFGDRYGRKLALVITMFMMAGATGITGLIPPYAQIGIAAPIILVVCRLVQGFAAGGEWGGATTFIVEYAPPHRRGLFGALQQLSTSLAVVSAVLTALGLSLILSKPELEAWGWRLPFILGFFVAPVGYYLRKHVDESPKYEAKVKSDDIAPVRPFREALTSHKRAIATIFGSVIIWTVAGYTFGTFLVNFATQVLNIEPRWAYTATLIGSLVNIVFIVVAGYLSDRFGRKPFLLMSAAGFALSVVPVFYLLDATKAPWALILTTAVAGTFSGLFSGVGPSYLCELLPTRVRYTALSMGYNGAVMLFGGFAPFIGTLLVQATGTNVAPAFYVLAAAVVSFLVILSASSRSRMND